MCLAKFLRKDNFDIFGLLQTYKTLKKLLILYYTYKTILILYL